MNKRMPHLILLLAMVNFMISCHLKNENSQQKKEISANNKASQIASPGYKVTDQENGKIQLLKPDGQIVHESIKTHEARYLVAGQFAAFISPTQNKIFALHKKTPLWESTSRNIRVFVTKNFAGFIKNNQRITAWNNKSVKLIDNLQASSQVEAKVSDNFLSVIIDERKAIMWNRQSQKIVDYGDAQGLKFYVENNFSGFQIKGQEGALFNQNGHQVISLKHRGPLSLVFSDQIAGFVDQGGTASFWDPQGAHIKTFTKEPGFNVALIDNSLMYRLNPKEDYQLIQ